MIVYTIRSNPDQLDETSMTIQNCPFCGNRLPTKWIVNLKGELGKQHEISVVKSDNILGIESWGWPNNDKIIISSNTHSDTDTNNVKIAGMVWNGLIVLAKDIANQLNNLDYISL